MRTTAERVGAMRRAPHRCAPRSATCTRTSTAIVGTHLRTPWRRPVAEHAREARARLEAFVGNDPWWLDAGCGTGASTARLARRAPPGTQVVGVDKSAARLARGPAEDDAMLLLRTDLADLWRLLAERGPYPERHFVLYPNPWPKAAHVRRRWHAHPVWPALLAVGPHLELRTNWEVYAREWARALELAGRAAAPERLAPPEPDAALTPHERKYAASGHGLWRVCSEAGVR
jgi:tRNA (guanine-N7-)-methyltransferase